MIKCYEKNEKVNYCQEIKSLYSLMFKIACHQGKHLTSKSGSLQTFLSCKFILYISPFPTNQCFSSPNKVPEPRVHQRALQAQRVSGPAPRDLCPVLPAARLGAMVGPGLQPPGRQQVRGSQQRPWRGFPSELRSLLRAPRPALAMGLSDLTSFSRWEKVASPYLARSDTRHVLTWPPRGLPNRSYLCDGHHLPTLRDSPMEPAAQCPVLQTSVLSSLQWSHSLGASAYMAAFPGWLCAGT